MSRYALLITNGAILTGCAVFDFGWRTTLITGLLLFLPLIDADREKTDFKYGYENILNWSYVLILLLLLLTLEPELVTTALSIFIFTSLPEEWFFRAYFLTRISTLIKHRLKANVITSSFFALLHYPTQGATGLLTFFPSLVFCLIYQKKKDLLLVALTHTLFNVFYIIFIKNIV